MRRHQQPTKSMVHYSGEESDGQNAGYLSVHSTKLMAVGWDAGGWAAKELACDCRRDQCQCRRQPVASRAITCVLGLTYRGLGFFGGQPRMPYATFASPRFVFLFSTQNVARALAIVLFPSRVDVD